MFHAYPPVHNAGAEWMAHTLLRDLVRHGHQVDVLLSTPGLAAQDIDGVRVHAHRDKADPLRLIAERRPDAIVTHLENTPRASVVAGQAGIPCVHLLHNTFWPSKLWIRRYGPSLIVANSEWMANDYAAYLSGHRTRAHLVVVRPPVDPADYRTRPGDRITLINLFANKGAATFWALANRMPDAEFLAVRGGYGEQVIPEAIPPNVEVIGNTPNVRDDVYARTRILLMPSEYESWGRVGVEAMCSGIPVIAHPTPGLVESLGPAGIFIDRDDIDGWEQAIRVLLKPARWRAASKAARTRAAELDPTEDLALWRSSIESLARQGAAA